MDRIESFNKILQLQKYQIQAEIPTMQRKKVHVTVLGLKLVAKLAHISELLCKLELCSNLSSCGMTTPGLKIQPSGSWTA